MALFFDADWFDARLSERGLSRDALGAAARLDAAALARVFKDQRELSAAEVAAFAELLGVTATEVADRAGVATPGRPMGRAMGPPGESPGECGPADDRLAALERRVAALEAALEAAVAGLKA